MNLLFEFFPLILFLGAFYYKGIYFALVVLMVAMPIGLVIKYLRTKTLDKMYLGSTIFLLVAGGLTLYFRDPVFIFWKPTAFYWVVAIPFLGSQWIGEKTIVQRMLGKAAELNPKQWIRLKQIWVTFFIIVGGVNLYVAYNFSEAFWVKFKLFGMLGLTLVFVVIQSIWLTLATQKNATAAEDTET